MPERTDAESPGVSVANELREVLASGNPQAVLNHLRLRGGGNSLALIEDMSMGRGVEGMRTNLPRESLSAIAKRYREFREDDTQVQNFAKAARPLARMYGMREGDMEDAVRAINRRLTRRQEGRLQERIADDPGEQFAQGNILGGLGAAGQQVAAGATETLGTLGNLQLAAAQGVIPGGEGFREAFQRRQEDVQSRIGHEIAADPLSTTGQIGKAVGRELPMLPFTAAGGELGQQLGTRVGGQVLGRLGTGLGAGLASSAPRIPEQARQLEKQGMAPGEALKEATKSALIETAVTGGFSLVGLGGFEDYLAGGGRQGVQNVAVNILRGGAEEAAEEVTQALIENTRTVLQERGEGADVLDAIATAVNDPRFAQSYDVAAGAAVALGGGAPALGAIGEARRGPAAPEGEAPVVSDTPAAPEAPTALTTPAEAAPVVEGADPVAQLDAIPRPRGVSDGEWQLTLDDARNALAGAPELARATVTPMQNGIMIDFGEGGRTAVLLASPEEMAALARANANNAWESLKARGKPGMTKAQFLKNYVDSAGEAAIILDPEGDAIPVGVNAVMYLNTRGFKPDAVTEELAHKAFMRHIDNEGLVTLREFLADAGVAVDPNMRVEELRDNARFQEAVVERAYRPFIEGEFDATPEAKGVLARIFAGIRNFIRRFGGSRTVAERLAQKPPVFQQRFRAAMEAVRSGEALATAPIEGSRRPAAPGPIQQRADTARKEQVVAKRQEQAEQRVEQAGKKLEVQEQAIERRGREEIDRELRREERARAAAEKAVISAKRRENEAAAAQRRAEKEVFASEKQRRQALNDAAKARNEARKQINKAEEEAKRAANKAEKLEQERADQLERAQLKKDQRDASLQALVDKGEQRAADELRRMELELARTEQAKLDADTELQAEMLRDDIRNIKELLAEAETAEDKKLFKQEIVAIRNKIDALRGENKAAKKQLMAEARERATFSVRTPNVSSLLSADPLAEAIFERMRSEDRDAFADIERLQSKATMELRVLGRKRVRQKLRPKFKQGGASSRYDMVLLTQLVQDVAGEAQRFAERGKPMGRPLKVMLEDVADMYLEGAGRAGIQLRDLGAMKRQTPALQYQMMLQRVTEPTNRQMKRINRMPPAEARAEKARVAAENLMRFERELRRMGIDPAAVLSPENMDNAMFSVQLGAAAERARVGKAAVIGAGLTWLTRAPLFGIRSALRITQAGLFGLLPQLASAHLQAAANLATLGMLKKRLAGMEVLRGDAALLGGLFRGAVGAVMTLATGNAHILSQVRGGKQTTLAEELGLQKATDAELLAPGNSKRAKVARFLLDMPFRMLGAADQVAQGMLAGFLEQTVGRQEARSRGLTGAEADAFVEAQADYATRDPAVQEAIEAELLDLAAARPFSGKGVLGKVPKALEDSIKNSHPLIRAAWAQVFPVFRGAVRGGEQALRATPISSLAFMSRDMIKANDAEASLSERRRAMRQAFAAAFALMLPALMAKGLDDDELEKLSEAQVGDKSFKNLPFTGIVLEAYGNMARAMSDTDKTTFGEATGKITKDVFKEMLPMRRLLGEGLSWRDSDWEDYVKQTPIGKRIIDWRKARGQDGGTALSATVDVFKQVGMIRDVYLMFDDEFVQELDWPEDKKLPTKLPRGEAGFDALIGIRKTTPQTTFGPPVRDGEAMTGPKVRQFQIRAQEVFEELLRGRDPETMDKKLRGRLRSRARKRAISEVGLR